MSVVQGPCDIKYFKISTAYGVWFSRCRHPNMTLATDSALVLVFINFLWAVYMRRKPSLDHDCSPCSTTKHGVWCVKWYILAGYSGKRKPRSAWVVAQQAQQNVSWHFTVDLIKQNNSNPFFTGILPEITSPFPDNKTVWHFACYKLIVVSFKYSNGFIMLSYSAKIKKLELWNIII